MGPAIVDTGPLVAFLDRAEQHHPWVIKQVKELDAPLLVCEPVLAEAMYLLARFPKAQDALFGLLENGAFRIGSRPASRSMSLPCSSCIRNIGIGRCRSLMPASFG